MIHAISSNTFLNNTSKNPIKEEIGLEIVGKMTEEQQKAENKKDHEGYFIELIKIREIAIKIARDEKVSAKEIEYIREKNPALLQKAGIAKNQAKQISFLEKSSNNALKNNFLAYVQVLSISDPQFSEMFAHASRKYKDSSFAYNPNPENTTKNEGLTSQAPTETT